MIDELARSVIRLLAFHVENLLRRRGGFLSLAMSSQMATAP
jgi:hypothetical protein